MTKNTILNDLLTFKQIKNLLLAGLLALGLHSPLASTISDDRSPADLASKASQAIAAGNKNLAIYYYTQALLRDPSQIRWREWVAQAQFDRGDSGDALRHAHLVLKADPKNVRAAKIIAELTKPLTSVSTAQADLLEAKRASGRIPFPEKSKLSMPQGTAAWVVGNPLDQIQTINQYNAAAPKSQQIRYIFIECGKIGINNGHLSLQFDAQPALQLAEVLIGDVWVFPMIGGISRGADRVSMAEWERMGQLVASKVEEERLLAGIYYEMRPLKTHLNALFAATKKNTRKPVGAGGFQWDALSFKYTDFLVLKAFGYSSDMRLQVAQLRSNAMSFLKDARVMGGNAFVGLPGIAATQEYEEKRASPDKGGLRTGKNMNAYFSNGLTWVRRALLQNGFLGGEQAGLGWGEEPKAQNSSSFIGLALWALYSGDGVHGEYDAFWYYPSKLDPAILEKLKLPLERR